MTVSSLPNAPESTNDTDAVPIGSRYVRALLTRHQVPSMRHVTTIAEVLDVGYTLVHRRMNGTVAWELEEIERVAAHFGESLADVFASQKADDDVPAMLVAGAVRVPCQLSVGNALREPQRNSLVAVKLGEQWLVIPATEAGGGSLQR
jgi:hypothetical protein